MTTVPQWRNQDITPGWWWLRFAEGPGPRHWDGRCWDRGFATADDYAEFPILAPCPPPVEINESPSTLVDGWTENAIAVAERHAVRLFEALAKLTHLDNLACTSGLGFFVRIRTAEQYRDAKTQAEALLIEIANAPE
jgi:hypothetical protein